MTLWRNWSGLESTAPDEVRVPGDTDAVVAAVRAAAEAGSSTRMVGTGHSFTGVAAPEGIMLRPEGMRGIVAVDRDAMTVTALAGTPLKVFNAELTGLGLGLHNMGDIEEQTLAGAVSTGTHGTGGHTAGLAAQLTGFELVTGTGEVLRCSTSRNPEVFDLGRVGLGALGVLTTVTFAVEPLFVLAAEERPMSWDEALGRHEELVAGHDHCDLYWFPHTDRTMVKTNDRVPGGPGGPAATDPLPGWRSWLDDHFLSNTVFGALNQLANRVPAAVPGLNQVSGRALSARRYRDVAPRVFTSERSVVFREMEYAVPREAGITALREARRAIEKGGWRIAFPVEVRSAPADDVPRSTAYRRDSVDLAFHVHRDVDPTGYFSAVEDVVLGHGGRPHWGKLHTRTAAELATAYPRFEDFLALRDRLDPQRVFANTYLRRVLGR